MTNLRKILNLLKKVTEIKNIFQRFIKYIPILKPVNLYSKFKILFLFKNNTDRKKNIQS